MIRQNNPHGELIPTASGNGEGLRRVTLAPQGTRGNSAAKEDAGSGVNLAGVLGSLRRRWFISTLLGLTVGSCGAVAAWMFIPAAFTATSEIRISSVQGRILFKTADERADFQIWKQTQMKMVKSGLVIAAALRDPELKRSRLIKAQARAQEWLDENLLVNSIGTEFFSISLSGEEPEELAKIVNAVTKAYSEEVVAADRKQRVERLANLEQIQRDTEETLRVSTSRLRTLSDSLKASNPEQANTQQRYLLELAIQMRKELADVHLQLMNAQASMDPAVVAGNKATLDFPDAVVDAQVTQEPEYRAATAKVTQNESHVALMETRVDKNHPTLSKAREQLTASTKARDALRIELRPTVKQRLADSIMVRSALGNDGLDRRQLVYLEARKKALEKELADVKVQEAVSAPLSFDLDSLGKKIAQKQLIADQISAEIQRLTIELDSPLGIWINRPAETPSERDLKKKIAGTAVAGLGLFLLVAGAIVWLEMRSRRISVMDEVVDGLSLPVLGTIPMLPRFVTARKSARPHARSVYWQNVLTESIDATRTMLLRNAQADGMNCVMIASAMEGEGKTTLACHLATSMARAGRSVVLVDCDFRRPSIKKVFGLGSTPGLSEVLRGEIELSPAIQLAGPPGLSLITAGQFCPMVLQSLAQDGMGAVLAHLRTQFDFVVVDSSPILPVTDALLVAQHVDGVVFAIRRDVSRVAKVAAACQRMSMLGVPFLGAVVIGLDEGTYGGRYPYGNGYTYESRVVHANEALTAS